MGVHMSVQSLKSDVEPIGETKNDYESWDTDALKDMADYYFDLHGQAHDANATPRHVFDTWDDLMRHCMDEVRKIDKELMRRGER